MTHELFMQVLRRVRIDVIAVRLIGREQGNYLAELDLMAPERAGAHVVPSLGRAGPGLAHARAGADPGGRAPAGRLGRRGAPGGLTPARVPPSGRPADRLGRPISGSAPWAFSGLGHAGRDLGLRLLRPLRRRSA